MVNPRGGKRRRQRIVLENRRHRRYRRNPKVFGFELPPLMTVAYVGGGYAGTVAIEHFLTVGTTNSDGTTSAPIIPTSITGNTAGKYAVRVGLVIGLTYLAKMMLGKEKAKYVGIGGGTYVLVSAVKEFFPSVVPGLSAYRMPQMGAYRSMSAYRTPQLGNGNVAPFGRTVSAMAQARNEMDRSQRMN